MKKSLIPHYRPEVIEIIDDYINFNNYYDCSSHLEILEILIEIYERMDSNVFDRILPFINDELIFEWFDSRDRWRGQLGIVSFSLIESYMLIAKRNNQINKIIK